MNISEKRQEEIFGKILNFTKNENSKLSKPNILNFSVNRIIFPPSNVVIVDIENIDLEESEDPKNLNDTDNIQNNNIIEISDDGVTIRKEKVYNIFDILGCFSVSKPCSVYLCDELIAKCASKKNWNKDKLEEIVYIHECAHYIHYHLNSGNFRNCPFNIQENTLYLETFAQLITHVISKELSDEHCDIFEKLKKGQSDVYTRYNDYVIACDKNYLLNFFLNPRPINIENVIDFIKIDYDIKNINPEEFIPWHW